MTIKLLLKSAFVEHFEVKCKRTLLVKPSIGFCNAAKLATLVTQENMIRFERRRPLWHCFARIKWQQKRREDDLRLLPLRASIKRQTQRRFHSAPHFSGERRLGGCPRARTRARVRVYVRATRTRPPAIVVDAPRLAATCGGGSGALFAIWARRAPPLLRARF